MNFRSHRAFPHDLKIDESGKQVAAIHQMVGHHKALPRRNLHHKAPFGAKLAEESDRRHVSGVNFVAVGPGVGGTDPHFHGLIGFVVEVDPEIAVGQSLIQVGVHEPCRLVVGQSVFQQNTVVFHSFRSV